MQQKNLIVFIVISAFILAGWIWLQPKIFPPKPQPDKKAVVENNKKKEEEKKPAVDRTWLKLSQHARNTIVIAQAASARTFSAIGQFHDRTKFVVQAKAPALTVQKAPEVHTLGGEGFFLTAKVTTHGAGVQQVTLNEFKGADRFGLGTGETLHLVPDDPYMPSFRMYYYVGDKDEESRPLDTLGRLMWKCHGKPETDAHGVQTIMFSTPVPAPFQHLTIIKTYSLKKDAYHIGLRIEIKNTGGADPATVPAFRYQLAGAHNLPIEGYWYTNTYRNSVVVTAQRNAYLARHPEDAAHISRREGGDKVPGGSGEVFIQYAGVHTQYFASIIVVDNNQPSPEEGGQDVTNIVAWARPTLEATEDKGILRLIKKAEKAPTRITVEVNRTDKHYILLPEAENELKKIGKDEPILVRFYHAEDGSLVAQNVRAGREPHPFTDDITMRVVSAPLVIEKNKQFVHQYMLYHGPVKVRLLSQLGANSPPDKLVDRYADTLHLRRLTDFSNLPGLMSWWSDLIITCTTVMHWLLNFLHGGLDFILPNFLSYGLSIILLTVLVRGAMFPVSRRQAYLSMRMQELAPEIKKLQEKYKNDPQGRNQAVMELYRKHHVNPLGSCLPLLLQMPIFMGLYFALQESIHFRLQPFLWIRNLAAPDMLVWWGENIPLVSDPDNQHGSSLFSFLYLGPYLNILPIFAVALMIVQQKMLTPPPTDEQQEMTQKMMKYMMVVFGVMFYKVAAGLCIYFIASSLWGVAERKLLPKKKPPGAALTTDGKPPPGAIKGKPFKGGKKEIKKPDGALQRMKDWWADVLEQARKK